MRILLLTFVFAFSLFAEERFLAPKILYLSSEPLPNALYVGQVIPVVYNATITERYYERLETRIGGDDNGTGIKRVSGEPRWLRVDENRRRLTMYYQIIAPRIAFPQVEAEITLLDGQSDVESVAPIKAGATKLSVNPQFCGVIAESLEVLAYKVERYSDTQNILAMEIKGELSNLDSFSLGAIAQEQGIDLNDRKLPTTKIVYHAIISPSLEEIDFNYFNPSSGDFKRIALKFDLSGIEVRSETNLEINPNKRSFPWLNVLLLSIVSLTLIVVSIKTRKLIFLGVAIVAIAVIFWLALREEELTIKTGAQIRLLPTATSTLFYITDRPTQAKILKENAEYIKVLLPDAKIGWVKKEETQ
ncbi:MAG: hypothetical protein LBQ52_07330 [Helicobacteraceae bacterium]|nr:hypothetical protein [Helicobacteraceae bacterium]